MSRMMNSLTLALEESLAIFLMAIIDVFSNWQFSIWNSHHSVAVGSDGGTEGYEVAPCVNRQPTRPTQPPERKMRLVCRFP